MRAFKIAALDLELRGAGNMLGGEQSGHIEAIGFEMYTSMLQEAVSKIKGESQEERPAVTLNLGISLRIDATYIPEENQRLRMYKRIAGAGDSGVLTDVRAEMIDRYGELPESVTNLLAAAEVRMQCERIAIAQLDRKRVQMEEGKLKIFREMLIVKFDQKAKIDPRHADEDGLAKHEKGRQFTPQGVLRWPLSSANSADVIAETKALLEQLDLAPAAA